MQQQLRELATSEIDSVGGGIWAWILDIYRDHQVTKSASQTCADHGGVQSVDTKGLTGATVSCQDGTDFHS